MTDRIIAEIRAALDGTERVARAAVNFDYGVKDWADDGDPVNVHIALHDPERELRMVAAHRKILDLHEPSHHDLNSPDVYCRICNPRDLYEGSGPCDTVYILAEAYDVEA